ncbi:unnamed protein product [Absidia cylindrospora]
MYNECNYSTIDWILQQDSTTPTVQQDSSRNSNTCITQQQLIMSIPIPFENSITPRETDSAYSNSNTTSTKMEQCQQLLYIADSIEDFGQGRNEREDKASDDNQRQEQRQQTSQTEDDTPCMKRTRNTKCQGAEPLSGRLDFRPAMASQVSDSQLKSMSPRERRQLRNKISARNFRHRKKEYMTTLEDELESCRSENNKLHTELTIMRKRLDKLNGENKQLRLDLVLYEQGVYPVANKISSHIGNQQQEPPPNSDVTTTGTLHSIEVSPGTVHALSSASSPSPPDLNILHDFSYSQSALNQLNTQQQQSPFYINQQQYLQLRHTNQQHLSNDGAAVSAWNMSPPDFNISDTYLSHATMPDWNISRVLSKESERSLSGVHYNNNDNININNSNNDTGSVDLFQQFPLLAPALMSIIVGHTMTLSTNDLLTLNLPGVQTNNHGVSTVNYSGFTGFDDKRALKVWKLLQPLATLHRRKKSITHPPLAATDSNHHQKQQQHQHQQQTRLDDDQDINDIGRTIQSLATHFEGRCVVTTYIIGQISVLHRYLKKNGYVCSHHVPPAQKINEINDDDDDNDSDDDRQEQTTPSQPSKILSLCDQLRQTKEWSIPVS